MEKIFISVAESRKSFKNRLKTVKFMAKMINFRPDGQKTEKKSLFLAKNRLKNRENAQKTKIFREKRPKRQSVSLLARFWRYKTDNLCPPALS